MTPPSALASAGEAARPPQIERLGDFFVDGFVICAFIALLTVAALHLLRPLMRKTAQGLSLMTSAKLQRKHRGRADEAECKAAKVAGLGTGSMAELVRTYRACPEWLTREVGEWDPMRWICRHLRSRRLAAPLTIRHRLLALILPEVGRARRFGFRTGSSYLPDELFMRTVENEAKAVLARPSLNPYLFALLAESAPDDAKSVVARVDALAEVDPAGAARLANPDENREGASTAAGIATCEHIVSAAAESWLDRFQLSLASQSLLVSRLAAVVAGVALARGAAQLVHWSGQPMLLFALGVAGGLLGLMVNDAADALTSGRRR